MSARPAFASSSTYTPRSVFAGGVNPWDPTMSAPVTAHLGASPFMAPGTKGASKSANLSTPAAARTSAPPAAGTKRTDKRVRSIQSVDITTLRIKKNVPLPKSRVVMSKYAKLFAQLEAKDSIECKPSEVDTIDQALRKYLVDTGRETEFTVIRSRFGEDNPDAGYVWLWPKDKMDEIPANLQSKGGLASSKKKKQGGAA